MTRDHIHPVAARGDSHRMFNGQEFVYACKECNSSLGAKIFDSVESRIKYLVKRYRIKYRINENVIWRNDELEELGPGLRQKIKAALSRRQNAERRVVYLESVFYELISGMNHEDIKIEMNIEPLPDDSEKLYAIDKFSGELLPDEEN